MRNDVHLDDSLYKILETRKILQIHHKIPTTFVIPTGILEFSGISFIETERGKFKSIEFLLKKESMDETWKIKEGEKEFEDSKSKNIAGVLLKRYQISFI